MPKQIKTICITGASAGIGEACAKTFAKGGHQLIIGARRAEKLKTLESELKKLGASGVLSLQLDVTDAASVAEFAGATLEYCHGKLDVLVNNAGLAFGTDHVKDGNLDDWQTMIDTNVMGVLRVTRKLLPAMVDQNAGQLVFLSSIAAHQVYEGGAVYCATKHAVQAIAKTLKLELNGTNIRVNTIDPGMVQTEFSKVRFKGDLEKAEKIYKGLKPLTSEDIANCIEFIVSCPPHVNIDEMIVMPVAQATVYKVNRAP
jgi:3-hydroxy acid dehydrogenase/malonic semialdehyde reductase